VALDDGLLHSVADHGEPAGAEYDRQHPHRLDRTTVAGRTAITRQPVHIPDVETDPEYAYRGPRPYRSLLGVPVVVEDDLIGVVVLDRNEQRPFSAEHIALAQTFADQAAIAIANARLLEAVERQRTKLSRFVSPQVAALISSDDGKQLLAGHRAYITVVYFDLRGFTTFAETAEPEELIDVLAEYHAAAGELVTAYGGTLEHFAGDGMMVFFNDPVPLPQPELQAARLTFAMRERIGQCAAQWRKRGYELALGAGIAVGTCDARPDRLRRTLRLRRARHRDEPSGALERRGRRRADSRQSTSDAALEERVEARPIARLQLKGFARPVDAYELLGLRG
jgi:adenylate cyclase